MTTGAHALFLVPALAGLVAALPAGHGGAAESVRKGGRASLCEANEAVLFQCRRGNRLAALCGRRTPATQVRYLFGRPGRIEYSSPAGARFWWTPGGGMDVRFRDGDDEYSIYRGTGGRRSADGRYEDVAIDGVRVMRGDRLVSDWRCAGEAHTGGPFQAYMPEGREE
jgi:hypothetical protein